MGASAQAAQYDCTMKMFEQVPVMKYVIKSPGEVDLDLENGIPDAATIVATAAYNPRTIRSFSMPDTQRSRLPIAGTAMLRETGSAKRSILT